MIDKVACDSPRHRNGLTLQSTVSAISRIGSALAPPLLLILVTLSAFLPILDNDFVAWDDDKNLVTNPSYRGLGLSNLCWACTTFHLGVYQPLAWMLLGLEYTVCGMNPRGYHLTSLILHMAVGVSLYLLTVRLLARSRPESAAREIKLASWLASALFLVHPLRVEVVAWVSCQGYLPCAWFAILAVLAYERSRPTGLPEPGGYFLTALLCYVAALLCHATAIGLPLVLILMDFYPLRRFDLTKRGRLAVLEKWPFLLTAAGFTVLGYLARGSDVKTLEHHGVLARLGQACYAVVYYVLKTMLPLGLYAHHPLPSHLSLFDPFFLGALAATILVSAVVIGHARIWPGMLTVWLSYLAILAPNSGLIAFGGQLVADRYSYLSTVAWSIMAGYWLARMIGTHPRLILSLSLVVIVSLSGLSRRLCLTWRDSTSLWTNVLAWDDSSSIAHLNLGNLLRNEGRRREAFHHYLTAAKHDPASPDPYFNSALLLAEQGRLDEAQKYLDEALKRGLPSHDGRSLLAVMLSERGRTSEAVGISERALREAPDSARVQYTHGTLLARLGRLEEAITCFARAIELDPSLEQPRLNLGLALAGLGRNSQAEAVLRDVLGRNRGSVAAHVALGEVLARRGDRAGASQHFQQALLLEPGHPRAAEGLRSVGGDSATGR